MTSYEPETDGEPDPGEIVWAWVPYEEDASQGKDRPVLLIGRAEIDGEACWAGLMLTSKDHDRDDEDEARHGRHWMDVGTGAWDREGRPSEVRLDRLIVLGDADGPPRGRRTRPRRSSTRSSLRPSVHAVRDRSPRVGRLAAGAQGEGGAVRVRRDGGAWCRARWCPRARLAAAVGCDSARRPRPRPDPSPPATITPVDLTCGVWGTEEEIAAYQDVVDVYNTLTDEADVKITAYADPRRR